MDTRGLFLTMTLGLLVVAGEAKAHCPEGMVSSGSTCVDRDEASLCTVTDPIFVADARFRCAR